MSNKIRGISFGFGKIHGRVFKNFNELLGDKSSLKCGIQLDYLPSPDQILEYENTEAVKFILVPVISPYSHRAINFWEFNVPIMAIDACYEDLKKFDIFINFDSGYLIKNFSGCRVHQDKKIQDNDLNVNVLSLKNIEIYTEISSKRHLEKFNSKRFSRIGIIKGEYLLCDVAAAGAIASRFQSGNEKLVVRFPDEFRYNDQTMEFCFNSPNFHRGLQAILESNAIRDFAQRILDFGFINPVILFPMISNHLQIDAARRKLHDLDVSVGASIETPAAVMNIASILPQVSFVEFGVNDLSQYTMGCSREIPIQELLPFDSIPEEVLAQLAECVNQCHDYKVAYTVGLDYRPNDRLLQQLLGANIRSLSSGPTLAVKWRQYLARNIHQHSGVV